MERVTAEGQGEGAGRVAFLGLGIMGEPMAANLARAGFDLSVWTRTGEKAERFAAEHGVRSAASPAEAAEGATAVVTMVPDAPEVEQVLLGGEGAAAALGEGGLCVDMSTIAPTAALEIGSRLAEMGIDLVDAPVTGSRPRAEDGTLTIMVGAEDEAFARARGLFEAMGRLVVHVGPPGHGAMTKVIANTVTAINAAALAEALHMVGAAGVDAVALPRGGRVGLQRLDDARSEGPADARAGLRPALQTRSHAEGRAPLPGRGAGARSGTAARRGG